MSRVILLLLAVLSATGSSWASAQNPAQAERPESGPGVIQFTVSGEAGQPLTSAAVIVRRGADSVVVAERITGSNGRVRMDGLPLGSYQVVVSLLGYERHTRRDVELTAEEPTVELGTIRLATAAVTLEAVVAQTDRPPVTLAADRTIYNTKDMPVASGGMATDVLRTVPEIEVDMNGKVSLRGTGVQIHLNGRPAPMQGEALERYLQQFPANRIERIEVIANPGARYEADGQGGIVNIVLKENVSLGLSGNVFINSSTQGQNGLSGRLSYQEGPLTLFGGGSLNLYRNEYTNVDQRQNLLAQPVTILDQATVSANRGTFMNVDLTAELKLSSKSVAWSELRAYGSGSDNDGTTAYTIMDQARIPLERYDRLNKADNDNLNGSFTLGFRHQFQPQRHEVSVEVRGIQDRGESRSLSTKRLHALGEEDEPWDELTSNIRNNGRDEISFQADYTRPLGSTGKLDFGYRGTHRETDNQQVIETSLLGTSQAATTLPNAFDYREQFHAFYVSHGRTAGKLSYQFGVRAEQASTRFLLPFATDVENQFENDYFSVFPNGNVAYMFAPGRQLRLAYSKRFERPYVFYLNPISPSTDPLNRYVGNPYLQPKFTHNVSLDGSWTGKVGTMRLSPYFRRTVQNWDQIKTVDELGVSTVTWDNLARLDAYGTSLMGSLQQRGRLGGSTTFSLWREVREAAGSNNEFSGSAVRWAINSNIMLRLTSTINVQGFSRYQPAYDVPQGRITSTVMTNIGVRQQLMGNKASLNLSIQDPFDVYRFTFETRDRTHVQTGQSRYRMRQARLTLNYNFGRPPQSNRRRPQDEPQMQEDSGPTIR